MKFENHYCGCHGATEEIVVVVVVDDVADEADDGDVEPGKVGAGRKPEVEWKRRAGMI